MGEPFRPNDPKMPVQSYQTWSVKSRPDKRVKTVCEKVGCPQWRSGWDSTIDERTSCGAAGTGRLCAWAAAKKLPCGTCQAYFIRHQSRRTFREMRRADGVTVFRFDPYQRCFADHQTMPEKYLVRGGDYRATVGTVRVHQRASEWVEHVQEHMGRLLDEKARGSA
jgi:hypothetical protein